MTREDVLEKAKKLRDEIMEAQTKVKTLESQIRHREGKLRRIVTDAYNQESEPIDGMTVETREVDLGSSPCMASPIGVCAYSDRVISLPGQRGSRTGPEAHTDACLFCGTRNPDSRWNP